jgi:aspartate/tyrosine/aromatic aminotransferase
MFEQLEMAPADPILGLSTAFKTDPNPDKINLGVGVYQDASGQTPIFAAVKTAEERVLAAEKSKSYLDIEGSPEYGAAVRTLLLNADHEILASKRAITVQSPGGTGALRIAGDFLARHFGDKPIWLSEPTWANHPKVFQAAGLQVETYPYFDAKTNGLDEEALVTALGQIPNGHIVAAARLLPQPHWRRSQPPSLGTHRRSAPRIGRRAQSPGRRPRLLLYRAPARHVLLFGFGSRAGCGAARKIRDLYGSGGRINVAGLTKANLYYFCAAVASVL